MISSHQNVSAKFSILRRVILYGILFFMLSVVQCSFLSRLSFLSVVPNIVLGGVCAISLLDDQKTATVCGICAGFLLDAIGGAGISLSPLLFMIVAIILLVFGHGLNMILNILSVIVHGIRLNTLEFSSHLDMSWSGHKFKPFEE